MRFTRRIQVPASPDDVWAAVADPQQWQEFVPRLARVWGASGQVRPDQHLLAIGRGIRLRVPIDVVDVIAGSQLRLDVHTLPGLREELTVELVPELRGGTQVRASLRLHGPLARIATAMLWADLGLMLRLLARHVVSVNRRSRDAVRRVQ